LDDLPLAAQSLLDIDFGTSLARHLNRLRPVRQFGGFLSSGRCCASRSLMLDGNAGRLTHLVSSFYMISNHIRAAHAPDANTVDTIAQVAGTDRTGGDSNLCFCFIRLPQQLG
jgi:hypothetical protein